MATKFPPGQDMENVSPKDLEEAKKYTKERKAYKDSSKIGDTKDENKEFSRGKRALGAVMAVPGAITGATLLGTQPDFPVYDSAKYGAKLMTAKNKREEREAGEELESAVKLRKSQKRQADTGEKTNPMGDTYKKGGMVSASKRADGCATKGKTKGRMI